MKYRKYAYVFVINNNLEWSSEDCASLPERAGTERDKNMILDFVDSNKVGSFIKLSTGEMVFQIT